MSKRKTLFVVTAAGLLAAAGVAWQLTRPAHQATATPAAYLPKATESDKVVPTTARVETAPHRVDSPAVELDLAELALLKTGQPVTGRARSTSETVTYLLKGKQSGQVAAGTLSVPGSSTEAKAFILNLSFDKDPVSGDQGILQLTVDTPGGPSSVVREVQLP